MQNICDRPYLLLKKWKLQGLSEKNHEDWIKVVQMTKKTKVEKYVQAYLHKILKVGHVADVPCYIRATSLQDFHDLCQPEMEYTEFSFHDALTTRNFGMLQILAPEKFLDPFKTFNFGSTPLMWAIRRNLIEAVKILAPLITNPNASVQMHNGFKTPIFLATTFQYTDIIQFLTTLTNKNA